MFLCQTEKSISARPWRLMDYQSSSIIDLSPFVASADGPTKARSSCRYWGSVFFLSFLLFWIWGGDDECQLR